MVCWWTDIHGGQTVFSQATVLAKTPIKPCLTQEHDLCDSSEHTGGRGDKSDTKEISERVVYQING